MPGLYREDALAFTDRYAEFQEGRMIVRVDFPAHGAPLDWLRRASLAFDAIHADVPRMVAFVRAHLRLLDPPRWRRYDAAGVGERTLIAYGIWIEPAEGSCCCEVSYNYALRLPPGLQALTEDDALMVERASTGWLTIAGTRPGVALPLPPRRWP